MATPLPLDRSSCSSRELRADVARLVKCCHQSGVEMERRFALRHGLAHVLAGHVADLTYAHDGHHRETPEEQLADAFAFSDLIPDRMLREVQAVGFRGKDLERWVRAEISRYATGWPETRVTDRAEAQLRAR